MVITSADLGELDRVKLQLAASFDMKDLGDLHYFLGIEVIRTPEGILISQSHYVLNMLFKFGMDDYKSVSTPPDRTVKLRLESGKVCDPTIFQQIVGLSLFIRKGRLGLVSILLYVDDLVITGADLGEKDRMKLQLTC